MKEFNIGDIYIAQKNYPEGVICQKLKINEKFKIIEIDKANDEFKVLNLSLGNNKAYVWLHKDELRELIDLNYSLMKG